MLQPMLNRTNRLTSEHPERSTAVDFQESIVALIRALGLHQPEQTPCGQPVAVGEAHALLELTREPGLSQNSLAARLRLEKSTVSRLVTMLERRGWIERQRDGADARIVRVRLTTAGREAAGNIAATRAEKFSGVFAAIPAPKREAVLDALDTLVRVLREA